MIKIIRNGIKCNHCGDIIESTHRHQFVTCFCGCCSVDGGLDYLRRSFKHSAEEDYTDLSETIDADMFKQLYRIDLIFNEFNFSEN